MRRGLLSGYCLLVVAACLSCGRDAEPPIDPARAQMEAEVAEARQALGEQVDAPVLLFQLGVIYERHGMLDSAAVAYQRATFVHEAFPQAYYQLGQVEYARGRIEEALAAYAQAVRFAPDYAAAYSNMGYLHKMRGALPQAEAAYLEALRCDSTFAEAHNNLGQVYKERQEWDRAIACYREAMRLSPELDQAYVNLAMAYREAGRTTDEASLLREMVGRFAESKPGAYAAARLQDLRVLQQ